MSTTSSTSLSSASQAQPNVGAPAISDPLIAALLGKLPPVGAAFPAHERAAWLNGFLAAAHFVWHPSQPLQVGTATPPSTTTVTPPTTDPSSDDTTDSSSSDSGSSSSATASS